MTQDVFAEAPMLFDTDEAPAQPLPTGRLPSYIKDHRKRLRERFMSGGSAAMPDYELLELVLFRSIPRQDVKPLARALMDTFGDFNRVLTAPDERLRQIKGVGDTVIIDLKILEACAHRMGPGTGDAAACDLGLGCAVGLLPYNDGASRDRTVSGVFSGSQKRPDRG